MHIHVFLCIFPSLALTRGAGLVEGATNMAVDDKIHTNGCLILLPTCTYFLMLLNLAIKEVRTLADLVFLKAIFIYCFVPKTFGMMWVQIVVYTFLISSNVTLL